MRRFAACGGLLPCFWEHDGSQGDDEEEGQSPIPLYIMLEGQNWGLTAVVITSVALWMVGLGRNGVQDIPLWNEEYPKEKWQEQLAEYGLYSVLGLIGAVVSVALLSFNLLPMRTGRWRQRWVFAVLGAIGLNYIAVRDVMHTMGLSGQQKKDPWSSLGAHFFLLTVRTLCAIIADFQLIGLFLKQNQVLHKNGRSTTHSRSEATTSAAGTASMSQRWAPREGNAPRVRRVTVNEVHFEPPGAELAGPDTNFAARMDPMRDGSFGTIYEQAMSPPNQDRIQGASTILEVRQFCTSEASSSVEKKSISIRTHTSPIDVEGASHQGMAGPSGSAPTYGLPSNTPRDQSTLEERLAALKSSKKKEIWIPGYNPALPKRSNASSICPLTHMMQTPKVVWPPVPRSNLEPGRVQSIIGNPELASVKSLGPATYQDFHSNYSREPTCDIVQDLHGLFSPKQVLSPENLYYGSDRWSLNSQSAIPIPRDPLRRLSPARGSPKSMWDTYKKGDYLSRARPPRPVPTPRTQILPPLATRSPTLPPLGTQPPQQLQTPPFLSLPSPQPEQGRIPDRQVVSLPSTPGRGSSIEISPVTKQSTTFTKAGSSAYSGPNYGGLSRSSNASQSTRTPVVRFDTQLLLKSYRESRKQEKKEAARKIREELPRFVAPSQQIRQLYSQESVATSLSPELVPEIPDTSVQEVLAASEGFEDSVAACTTNRESSSSGSEVPKHPWKWFKKFLNDSYDAVKEEDGYFKYSVWIKSAAAITSVVIIYTCILSIHGLRTIAQDWNKYWDGENGYIKQINKAVQTIIDKDDDNDNWVSEIFGAEYSKLLEYTGTLIPIMEITVWIGYPLGAMVGLYSLYSVMVQHKRLSLAMDFAMLTQDRERREQLGGALQPQRASLMGVWPELERKYPIGEAVYFIAILTSTAVIQLVVFGFLFSIGFGIIVNVNNLKLFMEGVGFYVLVYFGVYVADWVILHIIPDRILSQGLKIRYPRVFFVYMFVFSIVHLALGLFYALLRMFYMLVVAFLSLNRLDICLLSKWKNLDNGHRAFMSMLVLTHIIEKESFTKHDRGKKLKKGMTKMFSIASSTAGLHRLKSRLGASRKERPGTRAATITEAA